MAEAEAVYIDQLGPSSGVVVPGDDAPVSTIDVRGLMMLGTKLQGLFGQYKSDRRMQELRWLRNLRQYLGYFDPEVEKMISPERSKAYPKVTRVKCVSMLSRIMDLMFPSDDINWTIKARPSPNMAIKDVMEAIQAQQAKDTAAGTDPAPLTTEYIQAAVSDLASARATQVMTEIEDQLEEIGGDQSYDYVALNKEVVASGILYGLGVVVGPYARESKTASWELDPKTNQPVAKTLTSYKPQFDFLRCWDFYPDLSAKRLEDGDGYFTRRVMSRQQVRDLADREDFFGSVIKTYLKAHTTGNYKPYEFETELRTMGTKANVNEQKAETTKYEVICWHGPIDGTYLEMAGVEVADDKLADQMQAEVWMLDGYVIKAMMNPWAAAKEDVKTVHAFIFDFDDTAPIGFGLPNIMRDTQMSISAATRMMMDNASVVCGPILEVNTSLMQSGQDISSIHAYKTYFRDDEGPTAQFAAVREIKVESNVNELEQIINLFLKFADMETFVSPMNGGDMTNMPSEPMRNAAGASMLMGHAALPFKDIIRNFDRFTQSVIQSLVVFNRVLNPKVVKVADYDVIARGATSLIAKEIRGNQLDQLATSLTPEEKIHVDTRKLVTQRLATRDLTDMLVSETEAARRQKAQDDAGAAQQDVQTRTAEATIRNILAQAFKNVAQGQKNTAAADADTANTALDILERDLKGNLTHAQTIQAHANTAATLAGITNGANGSTGGDVGSGGQGPGGGAPAPDPGGPGQPGAPVDPGAGLPPGGPGGPGLGLMPPGGLPPGPGPGAGLPQPPQ